MPGNQWSTQDLFTALENSEAANAGSIRFELISGSTDIIAATMADFGDVTILVSVGETQILAEVLLWPVSAVKDPAAFSLKVLRLHKLMPLSTFGITTASDGEEHFELFGALSSSSLLENVVLELETLADNAIEAVDAFAADRV